MEHVDVFGCTYVADFGAMNFTFRVYADGTMSATTEDGLNVNGRWDDRYARGVFNGRVVKKHGPADYDVEFTVASRDNDGDDDEGVECTARLWADGMTGNCKFLDSGRRLGFTYDYREIEKYHNEREKDELEYFEFDKLGYSEAQLAMPCAPLTPGSYRFRGHTMSDDVKYHGRCTIDMTLRADHTLHGSYFGEGEISGTWTPDAVKFTSASNLSFEGTASLASLRGIWRTEDPRPDDSDEDDEKPESGQFDFTIDTCETRAWCEALHGFFPPEFDQSVRWLLLSSLRTPESGSKVVMPSILWLKVLNFTNQDWFEQDHETNPSDKKRELENPDESEPEAKRQRDST